MKRTFLCTLILAVLYGCLNSTNLNTLRINDIDNKSIKKINRDSLNELDIKIVGDWNWIKSEDFSISIKRLSGNYKIQGSHCFVSKDGMKLDCPDDDFSFNGVIVGNIINGKVKSSFEKDSLSFQMELVNDSILKFTLKSQIGLSMFLNTMVFKKVT